MNHLQQKMSLDLHGHQTCSQVPEASTSCDGQHVILANASDQHSWVYRRDNLCTPARHELLLLLTWPFHNALYRMTQDGDVMAKNSKST